MSQVFDCVVFRNILESYLQSKTMTDYNNNMINKERIIKKGCPTGIHIGPFSVFDLGQWSICTYAFETQIIVYISYPWIILLDWNSDIDHVTSDGNSHVKQ